MQLLRQLVQPHHQHLPLQPPLNIAKGTVMDHTARAAHTTAPAAHTVPAREQTATTEPTTEQALTEIARLANELCEHLADSQWLTAARIRELAETAQPTAGDHSMHARFEPLPDQRRSQESHQTAEALRARPLDWAHVDWHPNINRASNQGHRIRTGKLAAFRPAGAFEAQVRSDGEEAADVYARYVGEPAEQKATEQR